MRSSMAMATRKPRRLTHALLTELLLSSIEQRIELLWLCFISFPPCCSPVEAGNRGRDAGFIDEYKPLRIKPWLALLQRLTCRGDVRPVLFGGSQTFFKGQLQMMQKSGDR